MHNCPILIRVFPPSSGIETKTWYDQFRYISEFEFYWSPSACVSFNLQKPKLQQTKKIWTGVLVVTAFFRVK
jgi:hypothetical protein